MINQIGFPGLGLGPFSINRVAFTIGPLTIYWYAIIIVSGIVAGVLFAVHEAKRVNLDTEVIYDLILWGLPISVICARLYYVIFAFDEMRGNILNVFKIWDGGIAIYGGIIGAVLTGIVYCRKKKLKMGLVFDVATIPLMIGQAIGRWGNFVNAEVYGKATDVLWRMSVNGINVHPLFLYESLWMLLGICVLIAYKNRKQFDGELFLLYIVWYGIGRGFLEGMRNNTFILKMFGGLPVSQVLAFASALACILVLIYLYRHKTDKNLQSVPPYVSQDQKQDAVEEVVKIVDYDETVSEEQEKLRDMQENDERKTDDKGNLS